jgi:probable addiction module antidote protein
MKLRNFDDLIFEELQNQEFAEGYLQDALEEGGIPLFLGALKQIIQVQKGLQKVSEETGIVPEYLVENLSENGNPHLINIEKILETMGLKLTITT